MKSLGEFLRYLFFTLLIFLGSFAFADDYKEIPISQLIHEIAKQKSDERYRAPKGSGQAEDHASHLLEMLQTRAAIEGVSPKDLVVDIIQEGEIIPKEIGWIITRLHHAGYQVRILRHSPNRNFPNEKNKLITKILSTENPFYVLDRDNDSNAKKLIRYCDENVLKMVWKRAKDKMKWLFSLPNGFSLSMHFDDKTGFFKDKDQQERSLKLSATFTAMMTFLTWMSVSEVAAKNPEVNKYGALIVQTLLTFFWGYNQEASDRRHKQGQMYFHDRKKMYPNAVLFNLSMFFDSFLTNAAIQLTLFNGQVDFGDVAHWAENSAIGIFAKGPKIFLTQFEDKMSRGSYQWMNFWFNVLQGFMKMSHLYHWTAVGTTMFYAFAAVGVLFSGYEHFLAARQPDQSMWSKFTKQLKKDMKRVANAITGTPNHCGATLMYVRPYHELEDKQFIIPSR